LAAPAQRPVGRAEPLQPGHKVVRTRSCFDDAPCSPPRYFEDPEYRPRKSTPADINLFGFRVHLAAILRVTGVPVKAEAGREVEYKRRLGGTLYTDAIRTQDIVQRYDSFECVHVGTEHIACAGTSGVYCRSLRKRNGVFHAHPAAKRSFHLDESNIDVASEASL
jgi:hypothetical protein